MLFTNEIKTKFSLCPSPYSANLDPFLMYSMFLRTLLPAEIKADLNRLKSGQVNMIQLTPVTDMIEQTPTPCDDKVIGVKPDFFTEGVMGAIAAELGDIFGYKEQNGFVIHDIFPIPGLEHSQTGANSKSVLSFHSDGSTHPIITPDYLILYCIKPDRAACNHISFLPDLLQHMPGDLFQILTQDRFAHQVDIELAVENKNSFVIQPIILREGNELILKYDGDLVTGFDKESEQAITELNALIAKTAVEVHNQANSVLILNNKKAVHARSAFDPRFDGTDRWLQSAFVSKTPLPNGHVIDIQDRLGLDVPSHAKTTARDDILAY